MIEINKTSGRKEDKSSIKTRKKSGTRTDPGTFARELNKTISFEFHGTIDELMNDLKDQEKKFLFDQTYAEMLQYKALVQKILKTITEEGFKTKTFKRKRTDRSDFIIISEINQKMVEISYSITHSNKAFNLLKALDEIRGLVFDLVY